VTVAAPAIQVQTPKLLTKEHFEVAPDRDLVVFRARRAEERYSYQHAFNICQDLRLHCKAAMQTINESHHTHRIVGDAKRFAQILDLLDRTARHRQLRCTGLMPRFRSTVSHEGELITITVGNEKITMHWEDALKLSVWFNAAADHAKGWAGDTSQRLRLVGILRNATPD